MRKKTYIQPAMQVHEIRPIGNLLIIGSNTDPVENVVTPGLGEEGLDLPPGLDLPGTGNIWNEAW